MKPSELTPELVWQDDGHLTAGAIAALADAQDVIPPDGRAHADACDACATRVAEAALASLVMHEVLKDAAAPALARPRKVARFPLAASVGALALAAAGMLPVLIHLPRSLPQSAALVAHFSPVLLRGAIAAVHGADSTRALLVSVVSLVVAGLAALLVRQLAPWTVSPSHAENKEGITP